MKKILSLILAVTLLFSMGIVGATTVGAAEANLCEAFNDELSDFCSYYGDLPFTSTSILVRTLATLYDFPDEFKEEAVIGNMDVVVSKEFFNSLTNRLFKLDKSFEERVGDEFVLRSNVTVEGDNYRIHKLVITILDHRYVLRGYTKDADKYTLYFQGRYGYFEEQYIEELRNYLKGVTGFTDEELTATAS